MLGLRNRLRLSEAPDSFKAVSGRWGREQVIGLAPDTASAKAAVGIAKPAKWDGTGCDEESVWGECQGSGKSAYRACVDLSEPAFRCSCPSRKFPCKHALAVLLLWSDGTVDAGARPGWADEWLSQRRDRADKTQERRAQGGTAVKTADPKTAERRAQRVDDGVTDLDRWLRDQVTQGLAQAEKAPYRVWDDTARRLIDAQAPGLAGQVKGMSAMRHGEGWPERLLEEYALLRLLTRAHQRRAELPEPLRATVRSRIGFTVPQEEVLRGERVRDQWYVAGSRDTQQDQLTTRRVWLRGLQTARSALILSFAAPGRSFDGSMVVGGTIDADLAFYPGAQPLRALIVERHGSTVMATPQGTSVEGLFQEYADALARDPWLDRWPAVLEHVRLASPASGPGAYIIDERGDSLPLRPADPDRDLWRLLAVSGGNAFTLAGEWSPRGLLPLSAWHEEEGVVIL